MHINLSQEMEQYLLSKVGTGSYRNATEVVCDAIRRMREAEEKLATLRAAVQIGDDQIDRGEGVAYTPERLATITEKAYGDAPHYAPPERCCLHSLPECGKDQLSNCL